MMIKEIRVLNLNYWADELGRDVVAEKAGMDGKNYLNQLCTGHGSFGSRAARRLEEALGLEQGWFDLPHHKLWGSAEKTNEDFGNYEIRGYIKIGHLSKGSQDSIEAMVKNLETIEIKETE